MMVLFTAVFQLFPGAVIRLGSESALYNEFAESALRRFMLVIVLNGFQTSTFIFFQAIGNPLSPLSCPCCARLHFCPAYSLCQVSSELKVLLWSTPIADVLAFFAALICLIVQWENTVSERGKALNPETRRQISAA